VKFKHEIRRDNLSVVDTVEGRSFLRGRLWFGRSEFRAWFIAVALRDRVIELALKQS